MTTSLMSPSAAIILLGLIALAQRIAVLNRAIAFRRRLLGTINDAIDWPPVTILKPLCGPEPGLEAAIESFLAIDYPVYQLVFGAHDAGDPALAIARRAARRRPEIDIDMVWSSDLGCSNRKVANLMNMLPAAKHELLVISDSDMHVSADYLKRVVSELMVPDTGLVTTLYTALAADSSLPNKLAALNVNFSFLPGALLARGMGRQDCLGATMALKQCTLQAVGGLAALGDHIADDGLLGRRIRKLGLRVGLASTLPATTVSEESIICLCSHELRWATTIRCQAPLAFALSLVQFSTVWSALFAVSNCGTPFSVALFLLSWVVEAIYQYFFARILLIKASTACHLIPVREAFSVATVILSFFRSSVSWRGQRMVVSSADWSPLTVMRRPRLAAFRLKRQAATLSDTEVVGSRG